MRMSGTKVAAQLFESGTMTIAGAKDEEAARSAAGKYARLISLLNGLETLQNAPVHPGDVAWLLKQPVQDKHSLTECCYILSIGAWMLAVFVCYAICIQSTRSANTSRSSSMLVGSKAGTYEATVWQ